MSVIDASSRSNSRVVRLTALVSEAESAAIANRAEASGQSVSAYLRARALDDDGEMSNKIDEIIQQMEAALDSANAEVEAVLVRLNTRDNHP